MANLPEPGSKPPISMDIADRGRIQVALDERVAPGSGEDESWQVTIEEFATHRVIAHWSVRRAHLTDARAEDWAFAVAEPWMSNTEPATAGGSEHGHRVARGEGGRWHVAPSERPVGSSEWLVHGSEHRPGTPTAEPHGSTGAGPRHVGSSESWRRVGKTQGLEDRAAAERPPFDCEARREEEDEP